MLRSESLAMRNASLRSASRIARLNNELNCNAWELERAEETIKQHGKSRMDLLRDAATGECECRREDEWQ